MKHYTPRVLLNSKINMHYALVRQHSATILRSSTPSFSSSTILQRSCKMVRQRSPSLVYAFTLALQRNWTDREPTSPYGCEESSSFTVALHCGPIQYTPCKRDEFFQFGNREMAALPSSSCQNAKHVCQWKLSFNTALFYMVFFNVLFLCAKCQLIWVSLN